MSTLDGGWGWGWGWCWHGRRSHPRNGSFAVVLTPGGRRKRLTDHGLRIAAQRQRQRTLLTIELDCRLPILASRAIGRRAIEGQAGNCWRKGWLFVATTQSQVANRDNHNHRESCQQVSFRERKGYSARLTAATATLHCSKQLITRDLIDCAWPATRLLMDADDLLLAQALDSAASSLEPQRKIFSRLVFLIGLQSDGVITLFPLAQGLQTRGKRGFAEQENVRARLGTASGQAQESLNCGPGQTLSVIYQQINFLTREGQLRHLRHDAIEIGNRTVQRLGDLCEQHAGVHSALWRDDHTLHRLLVAAGHQGLTQQGFTTAFRPGYQQQ